MRVMCIDSDAWPDPKLPWGDDGILVDGEVYELVDVIFEDGYIWYEVDADSDSVYWENCFARLTDEQEVEEEKSIVKRILEFFK